MKIKITTIAVVMMGLLSGCTQGSLIQSDVDLFELQFKGEVGENVRACNPYSRDCIVNEPPTTTLYGLVRAGQFNADAEKLCYPLLENCQQSPPGPLVGNVTIELREFKGEKEPAGGRMSQTVASESGLYIMNPLPGDYWLTVHDSNNERPLSSDADAVFGDSHTFHSIKHITIPESHSLQSRIYLP